MEYKASLDTLAKIITIGVIIIFVAIGQRSVRALFSSPNDTMTILIHSGILLFFLSTIIFCYLFAPYSYTVNNKELVINRPISKVRINLIDIIRARRIEESEMAGTIRTFGVDGLFGYYGKYYSPKMGNTILYATQGRNRILIITTKGKKIIISPDDINIIEKLNRTDQR